MIEPKNSLRKWFYACRDRYDLRRNIARKSTVKPPPVPDGYEIQPPDFIGIGAQKAGTSWWHELITSHPEVYDGMHMVGQVSPSYKRKEHHFFNRFCKQEFTDEDALEYSRWTARPNGMLAGEFTPAYLPKHWSALLIKKSAPNARLLVMLRDPIDRFVSGMRQMARQTPKLTALDAEVHYYRGLYCRQLQAWLRVFPRSQLLILQYEKCKLDPETELRRTFDFIGLDFRPSSSFNFKKKINRTFNRKSFSLGETHRRSLVESYRDDVRQLLETFPEIDGSLWKHFDD